VVCGFHTFIYEVVKSIIVYQVLKLLTEHFLSAGPCSVHQDQNNE
jgi:hypothetical protein